MNKVVAVVGMCGTGKSVVTEFLKQNGFSMIYFGGVVTGRVKEMGLPLTQENERPVREALRKEYGMAAMAIVSYPEIEEKIKKGNVVIDGLYSWDEYKFLKEKLGEKLILLSVVSDQKVRYERLKNRPIRPFTEEEAYKRDVTELETLAKGGPIAIADSFIYNNGTEEELIKKAKSFMEKL